MSLHKLFCYPESNSRAKIPFGRKERFKDVAERFRAHASAVIRDGQPDETAEQARSGRAADDQ